MAIKERTIESQFVLNISNFSANLKAAEQKLKETESRFSGFKDIGKRFEDTGKKLTLGLTVPLAAAGAAILKIGSNFDEASDTIRAGTGATGALLDKLNSDFKSVYGTIPGSAENASQAITDLNARLGLSGKPLQDLSAQMLNLSRITKTDLSTDVQAATRMFKDAGIKQADYSKALDYTFRVTQQTGIGIDRLQQLMTQFGGPLRQMGFDWQTSAAMLGKFEKEGVNTELVVGSLRIALGKMAKEGIKDPSQALQTMIKRIKEAGTAGQANALALKMFGAKAGPDMAAAIREGRLDLGQLITTLQNSHETINKAAQDTMSLSDKLALLKQKAEVKIEPLASKALDVLDKATPMIDKLIDSMGNLIDKFLDASPVQQKFILGLAGTAAAAGPVLSITGKILGGVGKLKTGYTVLTTALGIAKVATTANTAATGAAAAATTGLGASMGAILLPVAGVVAGIAAITVAGVALYKHMSQQSIPAVNLYGKNISETTQKAVTSFMDLNKQATEAMNQLNWGGQAVTKDMATKITNTFNSMGQQIKQGLQSHFNQDLQTTKDFFATSSVLNANEEQKALDSLKTNYQNRLKSVDDGLKQINAIYKKASDERRSLTQSEQDEIKRIQDNMVTLGVQAVSRYETESKAIMERMEHEKSAISAQEASDVIKNSVTQKNGVIDAAQKQCDTTIAKIIEMRDEAHSITKDQADKLINEAIRQKDATIKAAEDTHKKVVAEALAQAGDYASAIDSTTGAVKTKWQKFIDWCRLHAATLAIQYSGNTGKYNINSGGKVGSMPGYASGTDYANPGLHWIAEEGYEIVTSPQLRMFQGGEQVLNHDDSVRALNTSKKIDLNVNGSVKVVGVNDKNQLVGVANMVMDKLMDELRMEVRT